MRAHSLPAAVPPAPRPSRAPGGMGAAKHHILTIALEDYFQVAAFKPLIDRTQWYRFERRFEASTRRTLDLLDEYGLHATFFVLGWIAETVPELVREVADRGHEVASKGFYHRDIRQVSRPEFQDDAVRSREAVARASGRRVLGYRLPEGWFGPSDLWALEVLQQAGYSYDSSVRLVLRSFSSEAWRQFPHWPAVGEGSFLEVPVSSIRIGGLYLPIAGGSYFRQFPHWFMRQAVAHWHEHFSAPYVMYFHTWELDPEQPRITAAPLVARIRHYRNLARMKPMLHHYFSTYGFTSIADAFGLDTSGTGEAAAAPKTAAVLELVPVGSAGAAPAAALPVTVVIPCYNEQQTLGYLANTLQSLLERCRREYRFHFIFVEDCSTDDTWEALHAVFGARDDCEFVRHDRNRGVAAAIQTGIAAARTEVVCSIDADCTYDPHELGRMIPLLEDGVDLVTASPYHPEGTVRNVPPWRLFLSKSLSRLYRLILREPLATYTSCFRVYRRSAALGLQIQRSGFLGVAEMLGRLSLEGRRIVEHPATLEVRILGRSKMKVLRTIFGHLGLLGDLALARLWAGVRAILPGTRRAR